MKILGKEYLVKNVGVDLSYLAEFQNIIFYLCLSRLNRYGGCILANSFGLGKTDIACMIAKYYRERGKRVIIVYPPAIENHWKRTIEKVALKEKEFYGFLEGYLKKRDFDYEKYLGVYLIIVDGGTSL